VSAHSLGRLERLLLGFLEVAELSYRPQSEPFVGDSQQCTSPIRKAHHPEGVICRGIHLIGVTTPSGVAASILASMNEERVGIELIVSVTVWFLAVLAAFFFVGAVVGIIVILVGVCLFGWWLVSVIRKAGQPPAGNDTAGDVDRHPQRVIRRIRPSSRSSRALTWGRCMTLATICPGTSESS
jgi:hypothetical protein